MLKYLGLDGEWYTLDLIAVKKICAECVGCMSIHMKDGSIIVVHYIESR